MTKRLALLATFLTVSCLTTVSISAKGSGQGEDRSMISVQGEQQEKGVYRLALEYHPAGNAPLTAGIMVWAEPSHTPMLVHWNNATEQEIIQNFVAGEEPSAQTSGELGKSQPRVIIPFAAGDDKMVVVELLQPDGKRHIVLGANVNLESFVVTTSFTYTEEGVTGTQEHCCSGPLCSRMCVNCKIPFFTCDLINCTIKCDEDSSGGFPRI